MSDPKPFQMSFLPFEHVPELPDLEDVEAVIVTAQKRLETREAAKGWPVREREIYSRFQARSVAMEEVLIREAMRGDVRVFDLLSRNREKRISKARWAVWRALVEKGWSTSEIGRLMGVDHTSVLYALRKGAPYQHPSRKMYNVLAKARASLGVV